MPISVDSLSVHDKVKALILEGSQFMPHFEQETQAAVALIAENYPKPAVREILESFLIGATFRKMGAGYSCPASCSCRKFLGEYSGQDDYFSKLWAHCRAAASEADDREIASMEEELGFEVRKVTVFESTETTVRFDISLDGAERSFMVEPERMYLPHDFAKAVLGKIQVVITVPPRKRWPLLVKKWLAEAERVVAKEQTPFGICAAQLAEFVGTCAVEATPETGMAEAEKGNAPVVPHPKGGWVLYMRIQDFLDWLERNKVKLSKNVAVAFLTTHGWYSKKTGGRRIRLWHKIFTSDPLSEATDLAAEIAAEPSSSPASPGAERLPGA